MTGLSVMMRHTRDAAFCCGLGSLLYGFWLVDPAMPWIVFGTVVVVLTVYSRAKES